MTVYRSSRVAEMYLYLARESSLDLVPAPLRQRFGTGTAVMTFALSADRPLARVRALDVLEGIARQGYFLQMPPVRPLFPHELEADTEAEVQPDGEG